MSRRLAACLAVSVVLTVLPIGQTVVMAAPPETVSVRLTGLVPDTAGAGLRRSAAVDAGVASTTTSRSRPAAADIAFAMVGLELPAGATAEVRTSLDGEAWGPWLEAEVLAEDEGPDAGTAEHARQRGGFTEPVWVGPSRFVQVQVTGGDVRDAEVVAIDPVGLDAAGEPRPARTRVVLGAPAAEAASSAGLAYVSREEWGADESLRNGGSRYANEVDFAVVHHTAGSNDYSRADAPAVVRGIYHYHTRTMGWDDIGYNVLVDRYGTVYEGRAGGMERAVIGAHARGYNTGSFGISVMGNFQEAAVPTAALDAVVETLAWKFRLEGIDAYSTVTASNGARVAAITAHRDVGKTACPGDAFYAQLPRIRGMVAERAPAATFHDVSGSVHAEAIERIAASGITSGCGPGHYCPTRSVTRGQMATFVARTFDLPEAEPVAFSDVPPGHTHAPSVARVVEAGIAGGYDDGTFRPQAPITREQMAAMLQRGLRLQPEDGVRFIDTVDSAYRGSINALSTARITGGCDDARYCPVDVVNRGQMASFLDRTLTHVANRPSDGHGDPEEPGGDDTGSEDTGTGPTDPDEPQA